MGCTNRRQVVRGSRPKTFTKRVVYSSRPVEKFPCRQQQQLLLLILLLLQHVYQEKTLCRKGLGASSGKVAGWFESVDRYPPPGSSTARAGEHAQCDSTCGRRNKGGIPSLSFFSFRRRAPERSLWVRARAQATPSRCSSTQTRQKKLK